MPQRTTHMELYEHIVQFFQSDPDTPYTIPELEAAGFTDPYMADALSNLSGAVVTYHQPYSQNRSPLTTEDWFVGFCQNGAFYRCGAYPAVYVYDTNARFHLSGHMVKLVNNVWEHLPLRDTLARMGEVPSWRKRRTARSGQTTFQTPVPPAPVSEPAPEPASEPEPSVSSSTDEVPASSAVVYVGETVGSPVVVRSGDRIVVGTIQSIT